MALEDFVVLALLVEGELVLEARATAAANADPKAREVMSACWDSRNSCTFSAPLSVILIIGSVMGVGQDF